MNHIKRPLTFLALLLGNSLSFAASLETNPHVPLDIHTAEIKFSDLNLSRSSDAQMLLQRVQNMAINLCKRQGDNRDFKSVRDQGRCIDRSYRSTLIAINRRAGLDIEAVSANATDGREIIGAK